MKRISRAPVYRTRWEHRALYSNTDNARTHARTHTHTHIICSNEDFAILLTAVIVIKKGINFMIHLAFQGT